MKRFESMVDIPNAYQLGNLLVERYLTSAKELPLDDGVFAVPAGYEEQPVGH